MWLKLTLTVTEMPVNGKITNPLTVTVTENTALTVTNSN